MRPLEALRAATRTLHDRLDDSEFAHSVVDASVAIERYASFLRAVSCVLSALEEALEGSSELRELAPHGVERRARLTRDLAHLNTDPNGVDAAVLHALVLGQRLRLDARTPGSLLGYLYVIEGSQLGGLFQKKALEQRPELRGGGLEYLAGAGRETQAQFRAFVEKLEAALSEEAAIAGAVTGATHAFEGFEAIVHAVVAPDREGRWLTAPLNTDAGTHPVPSDVREVQAALRAGERSFQAWAYYGLRYGERGLRFTRSDSCWLATLVREDHALALRHVRWLAGVLAARGMPTLLMEHHLDLLHAELVSFVPERAPSYEPLRAAARALRAERLAVLSDARMQELARRFAGKHGQLSALEAGTLVVAAVIDEKCGVARAVESLTTWLRDADRFDDAWRSEVARLMELARSA